MCIPMSPIQLLSPLRVVAFRTGQGPGTNASHGNEPLRKGGCRSSPGRALVTNADCLNASESLNAFAFDPNFVNGSMPFAPSQKLLLKRNRCLAHGLLLPSPQHSIPPRLDLLQSLHRFLLSGQKEALDLSRGEFIFWQAVRELNCDFFDA